MGLFSKKEKTCDCGGNCSAETMDKAKENQSQGAAVKILGSGCAKCNQLETNTLEALKLLGMDTKIDHVTDFTQIAVYGVMTTPALVYNRKVLAYGKVLNPEKIIALIDKEVNNELS